MESVTVGRVNSVRRWGKRTSIVVLGALLCCGAYLCFLAINKPPAPPIVVVSACKSPSLTMQRIQVGDSFAFFATPSEFCSGQMDDTPPFTERFCVKPKRGGSTLVISLHDSEGSYGASVDPMLVFSEYSERRQVVDDKGSVIGQDYWGYWDRDRYWRKVHLHGITAKYGPVMKSEAQNYDRILSSACFSNP
jgi:hypothetical protein